MIGKAVLIVAIVCLVQTNVCLGEVAEDSSNELDSLSQEWRLLDQELAGTPCEESLKKVREAVRGVLRLGLHLPPIVWEAIRKAARCILPGHDQSVLVCIQEALKPIRDELGEAPEHVRKAFEELRESIRKALDACKGDSTGKPDVFYNALQ